ncbi:MAG: hypothetical protein K0U05_04395 [Gammaproteobacteria bacterium]|nr:hypothetical protein [Gammaproteobacteria bacterium]
MVKLPKYISSKKGSLHYQRAIPTKLHAVSKAKFYYFALGLNQHDSATKIYKAAKRAARGFELRCQMLENLSLESIPESELDMLFMEIIRRSVAKTGLYEYEKSIFKGPFKFSIQISKKLADLNDNLDNFNRKGKMRLTGGTQSSTT